MIKKDLSLVVLAGGAGTRLNKILGNKQKCIANVNDKPFLNYILNLYSKYTFKKIYILVGKNSDELITLYHKKEFNFIKVICLKEKTLLGTGGALYKIRNKVSNFILVNGDSVLDINLQKFLPFNNKFICKMSLIKNKNYLSNKKLSNLSLKSNLVTNNNHRNTYMNGGVYYFNKKIFKYVKNKKLSLEEDILPDLISKKKVIGEIYKNSFSYDIGTKKNFFQSHKIIKKHFLRPAFFLDRDGVINYDYGYVSKFEKFKFKKGVVKGLDFLIKNNYYIFIITNQAGIAKKKFSLNQFKLLHLKIKNYLAKKNIYFDKVSYCPHHINGKILRYKKNCSFRKPNNGMVKSILNKWDIKVKKSFFIGDKISDERCAKKSNLRYFYAKQNFYYQVKQIHNKYNNNEYKRI